MVEIIENRGVMYLALGAENRWQAQQSIRSLRMAGNRDSICVVSDQVEDFQEQGVKHLVDLRQLPGSTSSGEYASRWYKTQLCKYSPFARTLYLDCDTIVLGSLARFWTSVPSDLLAMARDHHPTVGDFRDNPLNRHAVTENRDTITRYGAHAAFWNAGVQHFSHHQEQFFQKWHEEWFHYTKTDQHALTRAIYQLRIPVYRLDQSWNRTHFQARHFTPSRSQFNHEVRPGPVPVIDIPSALATNTDIWHITPIMDGVPDRREIMTAAIEWIERERIVSYGL